MEGRWVGLNEANRALKQLPEFARGGLQQVMDTTAFQLSRKASSHARRRAGLLQGAITWKSIGRWISALVLIDRAAFYWKFLEYGTVKMEARPFLRPAAESLAADHDRRLLLALEQAADRVEREAQ
jgi:HK97 gp10 family phage protein